MWMPMESPTTYATKINHRLAVLSSSMTSHFKTAHTTNAVKNDGMEYTSASTAENQNESEKQYANEPISPAPMSVQICPSVRSASFFMPIIFLPNSVIDQKRKRIVN